MSNLSHAIADSATVWATSYNAEANEVAFDASFDDYAHGSPSVGDEADTLALTTYAYELRVVLDSLCSLHGFTGVSAQAR